MLAPKEGVGVFSQNSAKDVSGKSPMSHEALRSVQAPVKECW